MAESYNTLAGLVQLNNRNLADLNVSDLLDDAPVLKTLFAQTASQNTVHYYLKQSTASSASFRDAVNGATKTASADTLVTVTLKIIDASFDTDVALADAFKGGRDAWLQLELVRSLKQTMFEIESQMWYGVSNDASGFIGFLDGKHTAIGDSYMTIAADTAGSTATSQTSVWLMRDGRDDVSLVIGNNGNIVVEDEPTVIQKAGATGYYPALYVPVTGYVGLQLGGTYSSARICNIETALTDEDIAEALSMAPAARPFNKIAMNRKALRLLRDSRTAYSPTGAPAPYPTEAFGVPIVVTDSILSTEAVET